MLEINSLLRSSCHQHCCGKTAVKYCLKLPSLRSSGHQHCCGRTAVKYCLELLQPVKYCLELLRPEHWFLLHAGGVCERCDRQLDDQGVHHLWPHLVSTVPDGSGDHDDGKGQQQSLYLPGNGLPAGLFPGFFSLMEVRLKKSFWSPDWPSF